MASDEWVISIKEGLLKEFKGYGTRKDQNSCCSIFRVPKHVKNSQEGKNRTAYTPEGISLGLFHRPRRGQPYDAPKGGEEFKQKMAVIFLTAIQSNRGDNRYKPLASTEAEVEAEVKEELWQDLCKLLVGTDFVKVKECYDLQHEDDIMAVGGPEDVLRCSLALDAIAVGCLFLASSYKDMTMKKSTFKAIKAGAKEVKESGIPTQDFLKLENQIPLSLLGNVLQHLNTETSETKQDEHLNRACAFFAKSFVKYLPGYDLADDLPFIDGLEKNRDFVKCDHLLHCIAIVLRRSEENEGQDRPTTREVGLADGPRQSTSQEGGPNEGQGKSTKSLCEMMRSRFSSWWSKPGKARADTSSRAPQQEFGGFNIPSATLLWEAGIDVRGCSRGPNSDLLPTIETGWFLKATLYIPRLPILPTVTWTLWRNILVYERAKARYHEKRYRKESDSKSSKHHHQEESHRKTSRRQESQIHAYLALMCCLVDTKEDVMLFTQGTNPVLPEGYHSPPEFLVEMFNTILNGLPFAEYPRWVALANQINKYRKQKIRRMVLETCRNNFGKPWLFAGVIAATLVLAWTMMQVIRAILAYQKK